jgi:hypothetical protein
MNRSALIVSAILTACFTANAADVLRPPIFSRAAGTVPTGSTFSLTHSNASGAVMFTLNLVDPRDPNGSVYTNARAFSEPITINRSVTVKARVLSGVDWSEMVEVTFVTSNDYTKLLITELMYQPPGTNGPHERSREFAEIKNVGSELLDISGVTFQGFSFPTQTVIAPGEFKVLVQNTNAYLLDHPGGLISGRYLFRLANGDSQVSLYHASGAVLFSMTYKTHGPWPVVCDDHNFTDKGFSLVPTDPNSNAHPHHYGSWRASSFEGGSPGADDPPDTRPRIKVTEVLARPDSIGYPYEAVEFYNPHPTNVDIGGWFLTDSRPDPRRYHIPPNTIVPAHNFLVLDARQFGSDPSNRIAFSSEGEGLYLYSATTNRNLTGYTAGFDFIGSDRGMTYGLVVNSVGDEFFVPLANQTIGASNSAPLIGPVVITELNYFATSNTPFFVELMNITDDSVPLFDLQNPQYTWHMGAGTYFVFPPDIIMPPRSLLLVVAQDPETFRARHAVPAEVPIFGPIEYAAQWLIYGVGLMRPSGVINDFGSIRPRIIPGDMMNFEREYPWPAAANGSGSSLQRLAAHEFGNDPRNWRASPAMSPGRPNFAFPIDGWRAWQFTAAELEAPAISGDSADPDNDGLNNVIEYALGLDPKVPGRLPVRATLDNGRLAVTVRTYPGATDIQVLGESAASLSGPWNPLDVETELGEFTVTLRDRKQGQPARFLRINVALRH